MFIIATYGVIANVKMLGQQVANVLCSVLKILLVVLCPQVVDGLVPGLTFVGESYSRQYFSDLSPGSPWHGGCLVHDLAISSLSAHTGPVTFRYLTCLSYGLILVDIIPFWSW